MRLRAAGAHERMRSSEAISHARAVWRTRGSSTSRRPVRAGAVLRPDSGCGRSPAMLGAARRGSRVADVRGRPGYDARRACMRWRVVSPRRVSCTPTRSPCTRNSVFASGAPSAPSSARRSRCLAGDLVQPSASSHGLRDARGDGRARRALDGRGRAGGRAVDAGGRRRGRALCGDLPCDRGRVRCLATGALAARACTDDRRRGDAATAETLARDAVALGDATDCLDLRAGTHWTLAELLREVGDDAAASSAAAEALRLHELKGNRAAVQALSTRSAR